MSKFWSFFGGIALGGLAGAVAGLLLAPKPGREFRAELQQEVEEILDEARKASEARRRELEDELTRLRGDSETF